MARKGRKKPAVPKGDRFMKGTPTEAIRKALKAERGAGGSGKAALILPACLFRRQDKAGTAITLVLFPPPSAACDRLARTHRGGINALRDKAKPDRPPKIYSNLYGDISGMIDGQPVACGIPSNVWTGRLIVITLSMKFGIKSVSPSTAYRMMRKLNKAWKLPGRPFDHRTPSGDVKERFKAELGQKIAEAAARTPRIMDRRVPLYHQAQIGTRPAGPGTVGNVQDQAVRQAARLLCRPGGGGYNTRRYYDRGNTECMMDFVRSIREKYGNALPVMDNASYHKYRALVKEIEAYGRDIRLEYLPAYSPDLNPVEMVWRHIKKYIANGIYPRVNDMTKAMDGMLRDGTVVPPSVPGYAMRAVKSAVAA